MARHVRGELPQNAMHARFSKYVVWVLPAMGGHAGAGSPREAEMARSSMADGTAAGTAQGTQETQTAHGLRRRGIIAGAAALAAGLLAREAGDPQRVAAAVSPDGAVILGNDGATYDPNVSTHRTLIQPAAGFRGAGVFEAYAGSLGAADIAANGGGVDGVRGGGAGTASGVYGIGGGTGGTGVYAQGGAKGTAM